MPARFPNPPANVIDFADPALLQVRKWEMGSAPAPKTVTLDQLTRHAPDSFDGEESIGVINPGDTVIITGGSGQWAGAGYDLRLADEQKIPGVRYEHWSEYNYDATWQQGNRSLTVHLPTTLAPGTKLVLWANEFGGSASGELLDITLGGPKPVEHLIDSVWLGSQMLWPKPPPQAAQAGMRHWQATQDVWYGTNTQRIHIDIWMPALSQMPALPASGQYAWTDADRSQEMMILKFVATTRGQNFTTTDTQLHDATVRSDGTAEFNFRPQPAGFEQSQALKMRVAGLNRASFIPQAGTTIYIETQYDNSAASWIRLNNTAFNFRRMA